MKKIVFVRLSLYLEINQFSRYLQAHLPAFLSICLFCIKKLSIFVTTQCFGHSLWWVESSHFAIFRCLSIVAVFSAFRVIAEFPGGIVTKE